MKQLRRIKESYLLDLLDETKRLIIARNVSLEQSIGRYERPSSSQAYTKRVEDVLYDEITASLLTALMVVLGYRIPTTDLYRLSDYASFCDWLGEKDENGQQKWEDG